MNCDGKWKLVSLFKNPWELYDISADRTELEDLSSEHPDLVARLSAQYDAWMARQGDKGVETELKATSRQGKDVDEESQDEPAANTKKKAAGKKSGQGSG